MLRDDVTAFLRTTGLRLNTDLGQHFLVDDDVLSHIMDTASIQPGERVMEIGPGIGILTRALLAIGAHVTVIEIDPRMPPLLRQFAAPEPDIARRLAVIEGNALHTEWSPTLPYAVVANIPYHITSPLLHRLLLELPRPQALTLLVQREVAEAIAASTTDHLLTILVQLVGDARVICTVPPEAFLPPPAVESAVLHISMHPSPLRDSDDIRRILRIAKHAMSKRRKMLRNSIGALPGGTEALMRANIDPTRRPESLMISEWIALDEALVTTRA